MSSAWTAASSSRADAAASCNADVIRRLSAVTWIGRRDRHDPRMTTRSAQQVEPRAPGAFGTLARRWAAKLTTFKRDGTPVTTLVNIAVEGDRAYFRTFEQSGKFKRLRNRQTVAVAPSNITGETLGPTVRARARLLDGPEAKHASDLIDQKHRVFQGMLVKLGHRLLGYTARHFELRRWTAVTPAFGSMFGSMMATTPHATRFGARRSRMVSLIGP